MQAPAAEMWSLNHWTAREVHNGQFTLQSRTCLWMKRGQYVHCRTRAEVAPENSPYVSPVPKRTLNTESKANTAACIQTLPANTTGFGSKNSRASVLLGKKTATLSKLVRIHSNDTIRHPLVKQSACSQGVWNNYSACLRPALLPPPPVKGFSPV